MTPRCMTVTVVNSDSVLTWRDKLETLQYSGKNPHQVVAEGQDREAEADTDVGAW